MAAADTPAETFKRALAHAARALAEQAELEVTFGSEGPRLANGVLTLPHPPRDPSGPDSAALRGQADRLALRLANHYETLHSRLRPPTAAPPRCSRPSNRPGSRPSGPRPWPECAPIWARPC